MKIEHLGRYLYAADYIKRHNIENVLDAACADGYGCFEMSHSGSNICGIDYNSRLIEKAKIHARITANRNLRFYKSDLNKDDLKWLESMDLVTCFDTIEHLQNPLLFLKRIHSLLTKNATLMLSVPKADFEPVDAEGNPTNEFHLHRFQAEDLYLLLEKADFGVQKTLFQPFTNMCMTLENNALRDTSMSKSHARRFYSNSKEALRFFARMYAIPAPSLGEYSYSLFVVARKN